jgi:hypothetical protein
MTDGGSGGEGGCGGGGDGGGVRPAMLAEVSNAVECIKKNRRKYNARCRVTKPGEPRSGGVDVRTKE